MEKFISVNIENELKSTSYQAFKKVYNIHRKSHVKQWIIGSLTMLIIIMFLPWTQNIRAKGMVTTLRQEQRPQELNTVIAGKVIKWYVKEGDFVKKGDTILQLGEVKVDYFDPQLLKRTQQQIDAKLQSMEGYKNKAVTAELQTKALNEARDLKIQLLSNKSAQQQLKVMSDSMEVIAAANELGIYKRQIDAARIMLDSGAISLSEFEKRKANYQNGLAKKVNVDNKLLQSKQELLNLNIEKRSTIQDYTDKISKAQGDKYASISTASSTAADIAKLENTYYNYDTRNQLYYITAPQSGQITKAQKAGIGEILKEGEMIVQIVPLTTQYAVEMFVDPMDLPLIDTGQKVRFIFDGFPAIVFSGWPRNSYGTFGGKITAIESSVSANGKFRVLVTEDPTDKQWPRQLKIGGGASGIALLKNVKIYYELWRTINGFPPEYYKPIKTFESKEKT